MRFEMTIQKERNLKSYNKNPKKCKYCGKELDYDHRKYVFCCRSCAAKYNNQFHKRSLESRLKTSKSLREYYNNKENINYFSDKKQICINCGKEINDYRSFRKFCSSRCQGEYKHKLKLLSIEQDTKEWLENPSKFCNEYGYRFIKLYLMNKFNNSCQICGWNKQNQYTKNTPLQVHHIDGDCTNNKLENLQLLCPNCHSLTENFGSRNLGGSRRYKLKEWYKKYERNGLVV